MLSGKSFHKRAISLERLFAKHHAATLFSCRNGFSDGLIDQQAETFAKLLCESSPNHSIPSLAAQVRYATPAQAGIHFPLEAVLKSTS